MLQRFLFFITVAWWLGGLTFYAVIVIPTGEAVMGNHREIGFITQQVTRWLNLSSLVPMLIMLWNMRTDWSAEGDRARLIRTCTWIIIAACQIGLFVAHPWVSRLLDTAHHHILDHDRFEARHNIYETIVTVQWVAAMAHIWLTLQSWRARDVNNLCKPETRHAL